MVTKLDIRRADFGEISGMREAYRREADCQIVHDSILGRGLADAFVIVADRILGYAGVWNRYDPGCVMEFHVTEDARPMAMRLFRELLAASGATRIEAQTNMPLMNEALERYGIDIVEEKALFEDHARTDLTCPRGIVRMADAADGSANDEWVLAVDGAVVGRGGALSHYNPPYRDIYMEIDEPVRRRGYGSFLVQELKKVCYADGKKPAARCDPSNVASRRTLERAGFRQCGSLRMGNVDPSL